jgi:hypothetical protein
MDCLKVGQSLTETTTETTTEINTPEQKKEKHRQAVIDAMDRGHKEHKGDILDDNMDRIRQYPEEVRPIINGVCELFNLKCPSIKSKHASLWITESRELRDACGEFNKGVLMEIANDFEKYMDTHGGTVPFTISSPASFVKSARSKAAELRMREAQQSSREYDGVCIPRGASIYYIGGKAYAPGIGEVEG